MPTTSTLEDQLAVIGLAYGRKQDIAYRAGLIAQVLGLAVVSALYPLESPFYTAGIMLFELGVLLSAAYLLVWKRQVKRMVLGLVLTGFMIQAVGYFAAPEQYAGTALLAGIGFVCAGAAGVAGKEAYFFGYWEGWLLAMLGFPLMVFANLFGKEHRVFNSFGFAALFLLLFSLTGRKLRQSLWGKGQMTEIRRQT